MKLDVRLKLQAYLDDQLTTRETQAVRERLATDEEAAKLFEELLWTKNCLSHNEPVMACPESREFYWGKIEREILRRESLVPVEKSTWSLPWFSWKKWLAPASGLALVVLIALGIFRFYDLNSVVMPSRFLAQVESPSEEMGAFSFRSQSENVFVIWLYERSGEPRPEVNLVNDMIIQ
jgi:hypothetical protein